MTPLQRVARRLGYDLTPRHKLKALPAQLNAVLGRAGVTLVLDVGANTGQYATGLRAWGYGGRIVSFEPLPEAHAALRRRAAADPAWEIAPPMALGAEAGESSLHVSAESDMSSLLPQTALLQRVSPSSRISRAERVTVRRLDVAAAPFLRADDRVFLKVDTQGYEAAVLAGASGLSARLEGIQLELPLVPCYEGETGFRDMLERMTGLGFELHLVLPGYFERKLARQLQVDVVFVRSGAGTSPGDGETRGFATAQPVAT